MSTITMKYFDKLDFVDEAKKAGFNEQQARLIANKLEEIEVHRLDDLATKADLNTGLKDLELRILKWQMAIAVAIITSLATIFKFLH